MVDLNWADWMIFAIVTISCVFGLKRGLVKEILSIVNWAVALIVALSFKGQMAFMLDGLISATSIREIVAFCLLFFVTLLVGGLVNYIVGVLIKASGISALDRLLGLCFGFARGCVVVMALLLLVPSIVTIDQDQWWANSLFIPNLLEFEDWARLATTEVTSWAVQSFEQS